VRTKYRHPGRLRRSKYESSQMFGMYQFADYAQAVYVVEIGYFFCIFFIKLSLLCLYLRIASPGTRFRKATIITMAIIVLQITSTVVVEAIQCIPMDKYWNRRVPGHCIDITVFFYCNEMQSGWLHMPSLTLFQLQTSSPSLPMLSFWLCQCQHSGAFSDPRHKE
jgi:hypothetical protein